MRAPSGYASETNIQNTLADVSAGFSVECWMSASVFVPSSCPCIAANKVYPMPPCYIKRAAHQGLATTSLLSCTAPLHHLAFLLIGRISMPARSPALHRHRRCMANAPKVGLRISLGVV